MRNCIWKNCRYSQIAIVAIVLSICSSTAISQGLSDQLTEFSTLQTAPYKTIQTLDGDRVTPDRLKGKVILVNFWATWCPPCIEELPTMQNLWEKHSQDDFQIFAVAVAEDEATVSNFLQELNLQLDFPIVLDESLDIFNDWKVTGLPTTIAVDRNGMSRYYAVGGRDFNSANISGIIENLVNE